MPLTLTPPPHASREASIGEYEESLACLHTSF